MTSSLFSTVADRDYLEMFNGSKAKTDRVLEILEFSKQEVAEASSVPLASVRYDGKAPKELQERFNEWANAINLVGKYFKDLDNTVLWFRMPNPLLGGIRPRDMIRVGRAHKLMRFIQTALDENSK